MLSKPDSVRTAGPGDEDSVFRLLIEMHRHNSSGWGFPYRPEIVLARIETATRRDPRTRTNPQDQRKGIIGVIDGPDGKMIGAIGVFLDPPMWFSDAVCPVELFLFVRPGERGAARHERDLMAYAKWFHAGLKVGPEAIRTPFPLMTGLMHAGSRFNAMERLWRRLSGGVKCGVLFRID